jgi:hypothetical protein
VAVNTAFLDELTGETATAPVDYLVPDANPPPIPMQEQPKISRINTSFLDALEKDEHISVIENKAKAVNEPTIIKAPVVPYTGAIQPPAIDAQTQSILAQEQGGLGNQLLAKATPEAAANVPQIPIEAPMRRPAVYEDFGRSAANRTVSANAWGSQQAMAGLTGRLKDISDGLDRYFGVKRKNPNAYTDLNKYFTKNADYLDKVLQDEGVSGVEKAIGAAVGGLAPGILEWMGNVPLAAAEGAAETSKQNELIRQGKGEEGQKEKSVAMGAAKEGAKRFLLGKLLDYYSYIKNPVVRRTLGAATFSVPSLVEGQPATEVVSQAVMGGVLTGGRPERPKQLSDIQQTMPVQGGAPTQTRTPPAPLEPPATIGQERAQPAKIEGVEARTPDYVSPEAKSTGEAATKPEQGITVYHGTNEDVTADTIEPGKKLQGIYTTSSQDAAKSYGKNVIALNVKPDAKVLDLTDGETLWRFMKEKGIVEGDDIDNVDLQNYVQNGEIFQYDISSRTGYADDVVKTAKSLGYDVVRIPDRLPESQDNIATIIINKTAILPQSPPPISQDALKGDTGKVAGETIAKYVPNDVKNHFGNDKVISIQKAKGTVGDENTDGYVAITKSGKKQFFVTAKEIPETILQPSPPPTEKQAWEKFTPNKQGYQYREVEGLDKRYFVAQQSPTEAHIIESERGNTEAAIEQNKEGKWAFKGKWSNEGQYPAFHDTGDVFNTPEEAVRHFNRYIEVVSEPWKTTSAEYVKYGGRETGGYRQSGVDKKGKPKYHTDYSAGHKEMVASAVNQGKPVPRSVLEEYKGEPWADAALAKTEGGEGKAVDTVYHGTYGKHGLADLKPTMHKESFGRGVSFSRDKSTAKTFSSAMETNVIEAKIDNLNLYKLSADEQVFRKLDPQKAKDLGLLKKDGKPIAISQLKEKGYDGIDFGDEASGKEAVRLWYEYRNLTFGAKTKSGFSRNELSGSVPSVEQEVFVFDKSIDKIKRPPAKAGEGGKVLDKEAYQILATARGNARRYLAPDNVKTKYLNEQINYGGEIKSRGSVIAEMQKQGTPQKQIDAYMMGAKAISPIEGQQKGKGGGSVGSSMPRKIDVALEAGDKPQSSADIIDFAKKAFNIPIRGVATFHRKYLGWFDAKGVGIRMKDVRSLTTASHEIAHHIDWTLHKRMTLSPATSEIGKELLKLGHEIYPNTTPTGGYKSEGWANFITQYLTGQDAKASAPNLYEWFKNDYLKNNTETADKLQTMKDKITNWRMQGAEARIESQISRKEKKGPVWDRIKKGMVWIEDKFVDELLPIKRAMKDIGIKEGELRPDEDPYAIATATKNKADAIAEQFALEYTTDLAGNPIGKSLQEILSPVRDNIKEFTRWVYAAESRLRHSQGKNPGITIEDADFVYNKYDNPEWQKALSEITNWNRQVIHYAVEAGRLSPETEKIMNDANPIYIPLMRAFEEGEIRAMGKGGAGGIADAGRLVKKMKGSSREWIEFIESMVSQSRRVISAANKTEIGRALYNLKDRPGAFAVITEVPAPTEAVRFEAEQVKKQMAQIIADRTGMDVSDIDTSGKWAEELTIFNKAGQYYGKDNIFSLTVNGKQKFVEVRPDIYDAIKGIDNYQLPWFFDLILGKPKRAAVMGITGLNPAWGLVRNFIKDTMTFSVLSKHAKLGPISSIKGIGEDILNTESAARFKALGGKMAASQNLADRRAAAQLRDRVLTDTIGRKTIYTVMHPIDAMRELFGITEAGTRIGEFSPSLKFAEEKYGEGTRAASIYALNEAQDVTTNFSRSGSIGKILNQMIPFFNPAIQGPQKIYRTFKDRPNATALKALVGLTVPAVLLWWKNKDEEWYKNMTDYEKSAYLHFEIPGSDTIIRIPVPFELGYVFQSAPVAALDVMYQKDPASVYSVFEQALKQGNPLDWPASVKPMIDILHNRNFMDTPIVPKSVEGKLPADQYTANTSWVMRMLGKTMNVSPAQLEYVVNSYSGGLFNRVAQSVESFSKKEKAMSDWPVIGTLFLRESYAPRAQIEKFYTRIDELNRANQSDKATGAEVAERLKMNRASIKLRPLWDKMQQDKTDAGRKEIYGQIKQIITAASGPITDAELAAEIGKSKYTGARVTHRINKETGEVSWTIPGEPHKGEEDKVKALEAELNRRKKENQK